MALVVVGAAASTSVAEIVRASSMAQEFITSLQSSLPASSQEIWVAVEQRCHTLDVLNLDIDGCVRRVLSV
jgi:hypothetical protein